MRWKVRFLQCLQCGSCIFFAKVAQVSGWKPKNLRENDRANTVKFKYSVEIHKGNVNEQNGLKYIYINWDEVDKLHAKHAKGNIKENV